MNTNNIMSIEDADGTALFSIDKDELKKLWDKVKPYVFFGSGVALGAVGMRYVDVKTLPRVVIEASNNVDSFVQPIVNSEVTQQILIHRGNLGHKIVTSTGEQFASINRAAQAYGVSAKTIASHIKSGQPLANGVSFSDLGEYCADVISA